MLNDLLIPASELTVVRLFQGASDSLGKQLVQTPPWEENEKLKVAILGIPESRLSRFEGLENAPDLIREQLYQLTSVSESPFVADIGNVRLGKTPADTYAAVRMVIESLESKGVQVLVFGGSQDLTLALLEGRQKANQTLTVIDDRPDYKAGEEFGTDENFLEKLPADTTLRLLGTQAYFSPLNKTEDLLKQHRGIHLPLGDLRENIRESEPMLREADVVSLDFGALKAHEAPGQQRLSPNGLYGEEACQLAWYAGMSTGLNITGIFGYAPSLDLQRWGAMMAAQIAWYFLKGAVKQKDEEPQGEATDFLHYMVPVEGLDEPIVFLKHPISGRWWMEVNSKKNEEVRIACSENDYLLAQKNEIPERWTRYWGIGEM
jgi:arginase family enzyme